MYGLRIGSTCSTPAKPSSGSVASSSRSPIAPITVASRPGVTNAEQPASSRRATTSSTCSWVALAPITMSSSGAPVTAIGNKLRQNHPSWPTSPHSRLLRNPRDGDKTLGNYSGGYRQYVATQDQGDAFFCIVDLHSITTPIEPAELREYTLSGAAMLFATGLDPERSTVFCPEPRRRRTPRPRGC